MMSAFFYTFLPWVRYHDGIKQMEEFSCKSSMKRLADLSI